MPVPKIVLHLWKKRGNSEEPDAHRLILIAQCQSLPIWREVDLPHLAAMAFIPPGHLI